MVVCNNTGHITNEIVKQYLESSQYAHLYQLYPILCDLLCVISGSVFLSNAGSMGEFQFADEATMVDLANQCLRKVGEIFQ
jgi:hypothetical protein